MITRMSFAERIATLVHDAVLTNCRKFGCHTNAGRARKATEAGMDGLSPEEAAETPEERIEAEQDWFKAKCGERWFEEWQKFSVNADQIRISSESAKTFGEQIKAEQDWFKTKYGKGWFRKWQKFSKNANQLELLLGPDLTTPGRISSEQDWFKSVYGDDWFREWYEFGDERSEIKYGYIDSDVHWYNIMIYGTGGYVVSADEFGTESWDKYEAYCRDVYGDRYDALKWHRWRDPEAIELLIQHAIKTGQWRELPKELQPVYHKRVGNVS